MECCLELVSSSRACLFTPTGNLLRDLPALIGKSSGVPSCIGLKHPGTTSKGSRHEDFCLLTVACLLAEVVVVSRDKDIATSCKILRELSYSIEHYLQGG